LLFGDICLIIEAGVACCSLRPRWSVHRATPSLTATQEAFSACILLWTPSSSTSLFTLPTSLERFKLAIINVDWTYILHRSHFEERSCFLRAHSTFSPYGA
jgi:hypothetical protein